MLAVESIVTCVHICMSSLLQVACGGCHMIVMAKLKTENGDVESEDEEQEANKLMLNGTLRDSNDLTLDRTFSARDRRRNAVSRVSR